MNITKTLALLAAASTSVFATQITGDLHISGTLTTTPANASLNQSVAGHATGFASIDALVATGSGSFAPLYVDGIGAGGVISYSGFSWSPASTPQAGLWTITPAVGPTFSFDLKTIHIVSSGDQAGGSFIQLSGTGILHSDSFGDTTGVWDFGASTVDNSATFSFHNNNTAVPDGGATIALLGAGLLGLGALRRKL